MRQHLIMGNWKLNGTKASVEALVEGLKAPVAAAANVEVAVCAPVIFLGQVEQLTAGSTLKYGSQDADVHTSGAFTGENSPVMLKELAVNTLWLVTANVVLCMQKLTLLLLLNTLLFKLVAWFLFCVSVKLWNSSKLTKLTLLLKPAESSYRRSWYRLFR